MGALVSGSPAGRTAPPHSTSYQHNHGGHSPDGKAQNHFFLRLTVCETNRVSAASTVLDWPPDVVYSTTSRAVRSRRRKDAARSSVRCISAGVFRGNQTAAPALL